MESDFVFLNTYLADEPGSLGSGFFAKPENNAPDPYHPTRFIAQPQRLSFHYRDEHVINKIKGDWENTSIGSLTRETRGVFSSTLPLLRGSSFAFSYKDFVFHADVDTDSQNTFLYSAQDYNSRTISFSAHPFEFLKAGIGLEKQAGQDDFFYDLSLTPAPGFTLGYRQFRRTMMIANTLSKDGYLANYIYDSQENVKELTVKISAPHLLEINTTIEKTGADTNLDLDVATFWGRDLVARYNLFSNQSEFFNQIVINDEPGGHLQGRFDYSGQALTCEIPSGNTRYFLGVKESLLKLSGAGKVSGAYILDFWQDLLAGDRYFNYELKTRTTQYHLGLENRTTDKLTTRFGLQYLIIRPDGNLDDWTPIPFINIGRLDEEIIPVDYTRVTLGVLALGFSYRYKEMELSYGLAQFIPLKTVRKEDPVSPSPGAGGTDNLGGSSNLGDHLKHNPGGNLQSLTCTWYF